MSHLSKRENDCNLQPFKHTELQPMTFETVNAIMNNPLEKYLQMTIKRKMMSDLPNNIKLPTKLNRASRSDHWYAGKMTQRSVPQVSRTQKGVTDE